MQSCCRQACLDHEGLKELVDFDVSHEIIKVSRHDVTLLQLGSEDGMSEYGDTEEPGVSIWQELQNETIRLDSRKSSSSSQVAMSCQWQI